MSEKLVLSEEQHRTAVNEVVRFLLQKGVYNEVPGTPLVADGVAGPVFDANLAVWRERYGRHSDDVNALLDVLRPFNEAIVLDGVLGDEFERTIEALRPEERRTIRFTFTFADAAAKSACASAVIDFLTREDYETGPGGVPLKDDGVFGPVAEFCFAAWRKDRGEDPEAVNRFLAVIQPFNTDVVCDGVLGPVAEEVFAALKVTETPVEETAPFSFCCVHSKAACAHGVIDFLLQRYVTHPTEAPLVNDGVYGPVAQKAMERWLGSYGDDPEAVNLLLGVLQPFNTSIVLDGVLGPIAEATLAALAS